PRQRSRQWQVLARRRPGITVAQSSAELLVLSASWPLQAGKPVRLSGRHATFFQTDGGKFESFQGVCAVLIVAVSVILLIGCVNLVNMIAARNSAREHEIALRMSLGASRLRLVRQLCAESLGLGLFGGAAGLFLSISVCKWLGVAASDLFQQISNGALGI